MNITYNKFIIADVGIIIASDALGQKTFTYNSRISANLAEYIIIPMLSKE